MTACWHQDPEQRPNVQQLLISLQKLHVAEKQRLAAEQQVATGCNRVSVRSLSLRDTEADSAGGAASTSGGNTPQRTPAGGGAAGQQGAPAPAGEQHAPGGAPHSSSSSSGGAAGSGGAGRGSDGAVGSGEAQEEQFQSWAEAVW
jgi:hypothetical protein